MIRAFTLVLSICCFVQALEFSHRIKALGTDFAHLIPDYETDLFNNPQHLGEKIAGLSYEPYYGYFYRLHEYMTVYADYSPINLVLLSRRFGLTGRYWFDYSHGLEPPGYSWESSTLRALRITDLWMGKIREYVINVYNDLDYSKIDYLTSSNQHSRERLLSYMLKTQASIKLKNNITIDVKLGIGVYDRHKETDFYELYDQHINTALSRIGLYWRDISAANKFMSCYFDIGSPMSLAVIDSLPYSIYAQLEDSEDAFNWFANALMVRLAVARSLPLTSNSFVAIGLKDVLYVQKTTDAEEDLELRGIENRMSAPIGIEYNVNTISVRLGVRFFYTLQSLRESTDEFVSAQSVSHDFDYAYSLGLGWKAGNRLLIDLYNTEDIAQVRSWAIYVKYLF